MRTKTKNANAIQLLTGWGIILLSYIFIRAIFVVFGFASVSVLGVALAVVPYLLVPL